MSLEVNCRVVNLEFSIISLLYRATKSSAYNLPQYSKKTLKSMYSCRSSDFAYDSKGYMKQRKENNIRKIFFRY